MESAAVIRSFSHSIGTVTHMRSLLERPGFVPVQNATWPVSSKFPVQGLTFGWKLASSPIKQEGTLVSCVKTSDTIMKATSDGLLKNNAARRPTFPSGFEDLVLEVCDETQIAELKLKIGDFEMHLKRNIESPPMPNVSHTLPPPVASKPVIESAPVAPPASLPKSSSAKINPFSDAPVEKSAKLAALEASGATGYLLVSSTLVGSFRKGKTLKEGKKQPPICKEGHLIKEGQTIGYVDQFGTELPMKSNLSGEVLKILVDEGEAIGYGDPIIAVLPSFHSIQ
ncbi:hypothetical protein LguiA_023827 [Lonicera macranthoides]